MEYRLSYATINFSAYNKNTAYDGIFCCIYDSFSANFVNNMLISFLHNNLEIFRKKKENIISSIISAVLLVSQRKKYHDCYHSHTKNNITTTIIITATNITAVITITVKINIITADIVTICSSASFDDPSVFVLATMIIYGSFCYFFIFLLLFA